MARMKKPCKKVMVLLLILALTAANFLFDLPRQWQIAADASGTFKTQTGSYMGNGHSKSISGLGFKPDLVIVKSNTTAVAAVFKTSAMPKNITAYLGAATANTNLIELDSDGFTIIGTANTANVCYTWIAYGGSDPTASGVFCVGTYIGTTSSPRSVNTGFQPDLVWVKQSTAVAPNWRSSAMGANVGQYFPATAEDTTGALFTTLDASGFTVGATNNVSGGIYYYVAFKQVTGSIKVGTYTGNATDNTNISGVGFKPDFVFLKNAPTAVSAVYSVNESYGDSTNYFTATANLVDSIQALQSDGFQVGANSTSNGSGNTIYYAAFGGAAAKSTGSGTFKMATGTYTGVGTTATYIQIKDLDFAPDLVIVKGNTTQAGVFRTKMMSGDVTAYMDSATADFAGGIASLNQDGFTIGASAVVNTASVTYYWTAYGNAWNPDTNSGAADFFIGAYYGNGIDSRDITRLPFQPDLVTIKRSGASGGAFRTSLHSGDSSSYFTATADAANLIQTFNSDGFQVGTAANVNTAAANNWFFAFKSGTNFVLNSYTGNGTGQNITTVGFQPDNLWVKAATAQYGVQRTSSLSGDGALPFINTAQIANAITGLLSNGFSVGTAAQTNSSGVSYRYVAWKVSAAGSVTLTIDETYDRESITPNGTSSVNFGTTGPENSPYVVNDGSGNYAIKLSVISNVNWDYTVQASQDLTDGVKTIPISQLKWDEDPGSTWTSFTTSSYTISSNNPPTIGTSYRYDYQLNITWNDDPGTYFSTITYTVLQSP